MKDLELASCLGSEWALGMGLELELWLVAQKDLVWDHWWVYHLVSDWVMELVPLWGSEMELG